MKIRSLSIFLCLFWALTLLRCTSPLVPADPVHKVSPEDPFKDFLPETQLFEIDPRQDNTVVGKAGVLVIIPEGSLVDGNGNPVKEPVQLELLEALGLDDMVAANLTTTSGGMLLQSGGMLFLNAQTKDGLQLTVDPNNPIYVEIPTPGRQPGMQVYAGIRAPDGSMDWVNPEPMERSLTAVDLDLLNFYPPNFESELEKSLPYRKYKSASPELKDSLFYALSTWEYIRKEIFIPRELNERTLTRYWLSSDEVTDTTIEFRQPSRPEKCGIDPALIKVLKSNKFQNSLISTREFEARLRVIWQSCRYELVDFYLEHINEDLWKIDDAIAKSLSGSNFQDEFEAFAGQRLTRVQNGKKYGPGLKEYVESKRERIGEKLHKVQEKAREEFEKSNQIAEETLAEYQELLIDRERTRMESYGFELTRLGWTNVDTGVAPKNWNYQQLEFSVTNGPEMDQVYAYLILPSRQVVTRLNSDDQQKFFYGANPLDQNPLPKQENASGVVVGFKGKERYVATQLFWLYGEKPFLREFTLTLATPKEFKAALAQTSGFARSAEIKVDLEYQQSLFKERKRLEQHTEEQAMMQRLWFTANPCCNKGRMLFIEHCSVCHKTDRDMIGPALTNMTEKRGCQWLIDFTQNSPKMIASGDPIALAVYKEYNRTQMTPFPYFTSDDIQAIYEYIAAENGETTPDWSGCEVAEE
ncbi:MAG: cytochrome c [Bacteroidia bacterium]|nr:cytochrome c [Bacteroidia bacterium]